jgi:Zn-dependent protease
MDLSPDKVQSALFYLIAFIVSVSVHEFGHAWTASRLGDDLPRAQGRLTLSPLAHIDLIGTIILPLVGALGVAGMPLIAWGKPVQTNPNAYTGRLPRRIGHMLVALSGPAMNLVMALAISLVIVGLGKAGVLPEQLEKILIVDFLQLNIVLFFFNLLPVPPLDGGAVLAGVLPESMQRIPATLQRYGMIVFFVLLLSGALRVVMQPAYHLTVAWANVLLRFIG